MCRKEAKGRGSANVHRQPSGDKDEGASICWCLLPTVVRSAHCNEEDMPTVMRFGVGYVYVDFFMFYITQDVYSEENIMVIY